MGFLRWYYETFFAPHNDPERMGCFAFMDYAKKAIQNETLREAAVDARCDMPILVSGVLGPAIAAFLAGVLLASVSTTRRFVERHTWTTTVIMVGCAMSARAFDTVLWRLIAFFTTLICAPLMVAWFVIHCRLRLPSVKLHPNTSVRWLVVSQTVLVLSVFAFVHVCLAFPLAFDLFLYTVVSAVLVSGALAAVAIGVFLVSFIVGAALYTRY